MAADSRIHEVVAVKAKGLREVDGRLRRPVAGSFGSRSADRERQREEGRLSEGERLDLLFYWGGFGAALGVRSVQGATVDRLMRAPPNCGRVVEDAVEEELLRRGKGGVPKERLVELLSAEVVVEGKRSRLKGVAATRYEVRRTLRGMAGAGRVEFYVEDVERRTAEGEAETVPTEMVRLVGSRTRRRVPPPVPAAERWARADAELEAYCQRVECGESSPGGWSRDPPSANAGRADAVRARLARLSPRHRRAIELAYQGPFPAWLEPWRARGEDVARLVPMTESVERARLVLAARRASSAAGVRDAERSTFAVDAVRDRLDSPPEGEEAREKWRADREVFVERVGREAERILREAAREYRGEGK